MPLNRHVNILRSSLLPCPHTLVREQFLLAQNVAFFLLKSRQKGAFTQRCESTEVLKKHNRNDNTIESHGERGGGGRRRDEGYVQLNQMFLTD